MSGAVGPKPRYNWWVHSTGATASFPKGDGTAVASAGASQTPAGKKVILHAIIPLTGFTGPLTVLDGAGASYFGNSIALPANVNGSNVPLDLYLENGLGISGGTTGSWLISYSHIN